MQMTVEMMLCVKVEERRNAEGSILTMMEKNHSQLPAGRLGERIEPSLSFPSTARARLANRCCSAADGTSLGLPLGLLVELTESRELCSELPSESCSRIVCVLRTLRSDPPLCVRVCICRVRSSSTQSLWRSSRPRKRASSRSATRASSRDVE